MSRPTLANRYDFSQPGTKRQVSEFVFALSGMYRVEIAPTTKNESISQRMRGYFHVILGYLTDFLNEPGHGDGVRVLSVDTVKDSIIGAVFDEILVADQRTGEVLGPPGRVSSESLSVPDYCKLIAASLEYCNKVGCEVPPKRNYYTDEEVAAAMKREEASV